MQHSQRSSPHLETVAGFEENFAFVRIFFKLFPWRFNCISFISLWKPPTLLFTKFVLYRKQQISGQSTINYLQIYQAFLSYLLHWMLLKNLFCLLLSSSVSRKQILNSFQIVLKNAEHEETLYLWGIFENSGF